MSTTGPQHSRQFVGNAVLSTILHFSSALVVLAITPYALWRIGLESYGLWALLNTVIRYSFLADIGIGPSVTKHVAQFSARGDVASVRATTTIGTLYFAVVGLLAMVGAVVVGPLLLSHLPLSIKLHCMAPGLLTALMGSVALNFLLLGSPSATLSGYGYFRYTSAINAAGQLVFAIVAVTCLSKGLGIQGLVGAAYAQVLTSATLGFFVVSRLHGPLFANPFTIRKALFGEILRFGGWLQVTAISWIVIADTPAILVGYLLGIEYVAFLDIATRLARVVKALSYNFSSALLPAVSALDVESGAPRIAAFLPQAMRLLGFVALLSTGAIVASSSLLLRAWLGASPNATLILIVLNGFALTYAIEMLTIAARTAASGLGRPWLDAAFTTTYAVIALVFSIAFARWFGLAGIPIAALLGVIAGSVVFFSLSSAIPALRFIPLVCNWLPGALVAIAGSTVCTWILVRSFLVQSPSRGFAALELVVVGLVYLAASLVALRTARFFSARDLEMLRALVPSQVLRRLDSRLTRRLFASS